MQKVEEAVTTRVGKTIGELMDEREMSIRELAVKAGVTYEHIRSVLRGIIVPSSRVLKDLCKVLKTPFEPLEQMMIEDKIRMKYGKIPKSISNKNPELAPIELVWDGLTDEHKKDVIAMANMYYKRDRGETSLNN